MGRTCRSDMETIGDLRRAGRLLNAYCTECGRERDLDLARVALADKLPIAEAGGKLKCRECGSTRIFVQPAEPAAAVIGGS